MLKPLSSIGVWVISSPPYSMVPPSHSRMPRMMLSSVVLPLPEEPRIETISPSSMERSMPESTGTPSKLLVTPVSLSMRSLPLFYKRMRSLPGKGPAARLSVKKRLLPGKDALYYICVKKDGGDVAECCTGFWSNPPNRRVFSRQKGEKEAAAWRECPGHGMMEQGPNGPTARKRRANQCQTIRV